MDQKISMEYTAVLLAAGYGSRISDLTSKPKCLLELQGETLLERNFRIWNELGIKKVSLVLGYQKDMIKKIASKYEDQFEITYHLNEDYRKQGNTYSLYLGIKDIKTPCLIFDADLIYEKSILAEFLAAGDESQILVGEGSLDDIECAKTLVDSQGFARMTVDKRAVTPDELEKYDFSGEAIGILKFSKIDTASLAEQAFDFLADEKKLSLNWEHLLNEFLLVNMVGVHLFKTGKWMEIDTPEDFEQALQLFGSK